MERMRAAFEVNTLGPLKVQQAVNGMLKAPGGKVVVISTGFASIGDNSSGGTYAYRTSKAAVNMVTKSWACDFKERGVAVAAVAPGMLITEFGPGAEAMAKFGARPVDQGVSRIIDAMDGLQIETTGVTMIPRATRVEMVVWRGFFGGRSRSRFSWPWRALGHLPAGAAAAAGAPRRSRIPRPWALPAALAGAAHVDRARAAGSAARPSRARPRAKSTLDRVVSSLTARSATSAPARASSSRSIAVRRARPRRGRPRRRAGRAQRAPRARRALLKLGRVVARASRARERARARRRRARGAGVAVVGCAGRCGSRRRPERGMATRWPRRRARELAGARVRAAERVEQDCAAHHETISRRRRRWSTASGIRPVGVWFSGDADDSCAGDWTHARIHTHTHTHTHATAMAPSSGRGGPEMALSFGLVGVSCVSAQSTVHWSSRRWCGSSRRDERRTRRRERRRAARAGMFATTAQIFRAEGVAGLYRGFRRPLRELRTRRCASGCASRSSSRSRDPRERRARGREGARRARRGRSRGRREPTDLLTSA